MQPGLFHDGMRIFEASFTGQLTSGDMSLAFAVGQGCFCWLTKAVFAHKANFVHD